ncbi:MAG TPA: hypothetical protein VGM90_10015 [Kofleriaceae bacterium]|jgi:hypothetical protein
MGSSIWIVTSLSVGLLAGACGGDKTNGETCTPECGDMQCGDDGCGGTCGTCGAPQTCGGTGTPGVCGMPTHSCGMQLNENPVAFCETFDSPNPIFNRSGEMNGDVWGVQRIGGPLNIGQPFAWANTKLDLCGTMINASAESDLRVCSGQLREATDDNLPGTFEAGGPTAITMYAKQPFDFKGRTGTIAFDVTNDSAGTHAAWPELWVTDQPVPAPWIHFGSLISHPKNGLAIRMAAAVGPGGQGECPNQDNLDKTRWTVDSAAVIRNFVMEDTVSEHDSTCLGAKSCFTGDLKVDLLDCVTEDPDAGPNGGFNHVEVKVSKDTIDVYATDAGVATPLKHIASITGANLSFDNGVVWIDDSHYNADKGPEDRPSQRVHTFAWDNIAFDGPLLPRHLSFDVLDSKVPVTDGTGGVLLGWSSTPTQPVSVSTLPMTAENISAASSALLMFNFYLREPQIATFHYSINGHAHTYAWPYPDNQGNTPRTLAIPVDLGELVAGPNAITLGTTTDGQESGNAEWAHINIALLDAGGVVAPAMGYQ